MYVCLCKGITEATVRAVGSSCHGCPELLAATLGIDDERCCGRCIRNIHEFVAISAETLVAQAQSI